MTNENALRIAILRKQELNHTRMHQSTVSCWLPAPTCCYTAPLALLQHVFHASVGVCVRCHRNQMRKRPTTATLLAVNKRANLLAVYKRSSHVPGRHYYLYNTSTAVLHTVNGLLAVVAEYSIS